MAAAALVGASLASAAEAPLVLQPTSSWNIDYAEDSCALRRIFGDGERSFILEFRRFEPSRYATVLLAGKGIRPRKVESLQIRFGEEPPAWTSNVMAILLPLEYSGFNFSAVPVPNSAIRQAADGTSVSQTEISETELSAWEKALTSISVPRGFDRPLTIVTGSMLRPMEALRKCADELVTHWGVDVAAHKSLSRKVQPLDQRSLNKALLATYPLYPLSLGQGGIVRVRLMIDVQGNPTSCHIQWKTREDNFIATACRNLMTYGKFSPALDKNGQPIASYYITGINYRIN